MVLLLGVLAFAVRTTRLVAFAQHRAGQHYEDIYYLPSPASLPVLSLGYRAAVADLIWCKSLVYFGEELGHRGIVKYVFAYTDAILALDPSFRAAYRWVADAALYRPTAVSMEDGLHAARYLERATERWPEDGELHWDYGSMLRFELAPMEPDPAKKRALLEEAAPHLEVAARRGAGPPWLALNNAVLLNKLGRAEQAIRQLEDLRDTVQDDNIRRDIDWQLHKLKTETYLQAMRVSEESFEQDRLGSYPYLSPDLFWIVGNKPAPGAHERYLTDLFRDPYPASDAPED
ncbi:MAG: hypothetical protein JWN04_6207 [Myxococcaceae bacterium]|nr:hypothetical protein [Myxococcaceae bacterium]